jgi:hypothetical protein
VKILLVCQLTKEQDPLTHEQPKVVNLKYEAPKRSTFKIIKKVE